MDSNANVRNGQTDVVTDVNMVESETITNGSSAGDHASVGDFGRSTESDDELMSEHAESVSERESEVDELAEAEREAELVSEDVESVSEIESEDGSERGSEEGSYGDSEDDDEGSAMDGLEDGSKDEEEGDSESETRDNGGTWGWVMRSMFGDLDRDSEDGEYDEDEEAEDAMESVNAYLGHKELMRRLREGIHDATTSMLYRAAISGVWPDCRTYDFEVSESEDGEGDDDDEDQDEEEDEDMQSC